MKQGWEIKKLGDIASIKSGKSIDANQISCNTSLYPCYGGNGIRGFVNSYSYDGCFPIIGRVGALCGNVHLAKGRFYATEHALVVKIKENNINPKWLKYNLISLNLKKIAKGVAQPVIAASEASKISIPVPPIAEQEKIVAELDCLSGIIEKKKQQLKEYDALAQSIFYEMFGDPVENEKGWEMKKMGDISTIGTGATPSRLKEDLYYGGGIPWVKTTEVQNCDITKTEETITKLAIEETNCKLYPSGTLLMAMYGQGKTRGQIAKLKISATTNQACAAIMLNETICNLEYIYELLFINYDNIRAMAQGGNQANLNLKLVSSIPIILPPLSLQQAFATKIEAIEKQKELIKKSIEEVETLFNSRMEYYFN